MNLYRRVIGYYRPYLGTICFSLILLVIGVNFNLLKYWPIQWVIDHVITVGPGGRVHWATLSFTTGQAALDWPVPDVVLLDLGLPDIDGIEVCRRLRQACDAAIIVVTARGEELDRVLALDEGADDYLIKPFGLQELLARIRAVLRRSRQPAGQVLQHGPLTVDLRTHKVTVDGNQIAVTPKEFAILECLASDPGRVVSRQEMLERAWDEHWYGPTKVLDVHMAALRKKLGDPGLIETVYGHGFRLADQSSLT